MNRRDIIIITVLINTGLLSALAMMAISTDDQGLMDQTEFNQLATNHEADKLKDEPVAIVHNTTISTDEWDTVLKDYVASNSSQMVQPLDDMIEEFEAPVVEPKKIVEAPKPKVQPIAIATPKKVVEANPKKGVEITVKRGDVLEKIARANGTTVEQIRTLNQLKNDRLTVGQTLFVPASTEKKTLQQAKPETKNLTEKKNSVDEVEYYVIKSGDNPWKIAKQYHVKFEDLLKLNHLDEEKARNLKIGDRIRVK